MVRTAALVDLRTRAERCLANDAPSLAETHALAAAALAFTREVERDSRSGHPYRDAHAKPANFTGASSTPELTSLAALERALDECRARLHAAEREIEALRHGGR